MGRRKRRCGQTPYRKCHHCGELFRSYAYEQAWLIEKTGSANVCNRCRYKLDRQQTVTVQFNRPMIRKPRRYGFQSQPIAFRKGGQ